MSTSVYKNQCIVVFGAVSIQRYIFQSNRLKEIIGASYLAKFWFDDGLIASVKKVNFSIDTTVWEAYKDNPSISLTEVPVSMTADVNVIYIGGGNTALLCRGRDIATQVVKTWSYELLEKAPGLRVAVGYSEVSDSLKDAYDAASKQLARCEEALSFGAALHSLPVVRTCTTTGLPASVLSREDNNQNEWISQSAASKREQVGTENHPGAAQKNITDEFKSVLKNNQRFAIELDKLGGSEGQSYIAVVHADGNDMGKRLTEVVSNAKEDADFLHRIRAFSTSVSNLSQSALEKTLQYFQDVFPLEGLRHPDNIFPFRPIVYGGDDLTFVCDGRIGLHLAAYYLQEFAKGTISVSGERQSIDACAGVAIVPTKFPFAQAYGFADVLCGLAKSHRREMDDPSGSWLDFQIIQEGVTGSVTALRSAQYCSFEGQTLHQRPYLVPGKWDDFVAILREFRSKRWPRSRAKSLLQALTQGPTATQRFIEGANWRGVSLPTSDVDDTGWEGGDAPEMTTPYFDPLEALDFYLEGLLVLSSANGDGEEEDTV